MCVRMCVCIHLHAFCRTAGNLTRVHFEPQLWVKGLRIAHFFWRFIVGIFVLPFISATHTVHSRVYCDQGWVCNSCVWRRRLNASASTTSSWRSCQREQLRLIFKVKSNLCQANILYSVACHKFWPINLRFSNWHYSVLMQSLNVVSLFVSLASECGLQCMCHIRFRFSQRARCKQQ